VKTPVPAPSPGRLILFLAGDAPSSQRARHNLKSALLERGIADASITEVNVLAEPSVALQKRIFATPALIAEREDLNIIIYGDLSEQATLVRFLDGALAAMA